ncbi:hypothetical protein B0I32_106314 [Nonomuraea fuscirosea]|uniref:Uncharacterized protein n=1 Tax=Nonomuraea fuscirosea TaxID=1291556 RepID=A0A2T0N2G4_9ACTN|nr:hypothetical protein [Nonomuraea fuscirosea]PRX66178.1 hypothetical protein B0I32_106314 [Nonomuraea fuscirosea]
MSAWIWLHEKGKSPWADDTKMYRFEVRTVAHARELVATLHPDAPELDAMVVLACEYTNCMTMLLIAEEAADSVERGREIAYHPTALRGGWYSAVYKGRRADICQMHFEVDPGTHRPQPVGTMAAVRKAAEEAPVGGDQLDLFGSL